MPHNVSRRTVLGAVGSLAVAGLAPAARAQNAPLRVGILPIFDVAPFYAAQQQGYFAAENVAVEPIIIRGGAAGLPALVSNSLDILYTNSTSVALAVERGIDLRIILQGILIGRKPPDPGAILKRRGDPYKTGKDLEGKVMGANALRDEGWMFVEGWIKATGGDTDKVQMVEVSMPAMGAAVKEKRLEAGFVLEPFMTVALADPALEVLDWPMSRVYPDGPAAFWAITPQLAAQRGPEIRAFVRAYKRGAQWVNENLRKETLFGLIADFSKMNVDVVRNIVMPPAHADITPNAFPRLIALMRETGLLNDNVDLRSKIFT